MLQQHEKNSLLNSFLSFAFVDPSNIPGYCKSNPSYKQQVDEAAYCRTRAAGKVLRDFCYICYQPKTE